MTEKLIIEGKTSEEILKTEFIKNIDVKVINVNDANIVINSSGCIGSELTYSGLPGKKVRITY